MTKIIKLTSTLCLFFVFYAASGSAQTTLPDSARTKTDYCKIDSAAAFALIGKTAQIAHDGGVYSTLNDSESLKWPSAEMRKLGGRSGWKKYKPAKGDTGTIVHVFFDSGSTSKFIYLLKVKDKYVPVGCGYIAEVESEKL
ncbi:hypothetical protein IDJ77_11780 [Mucilaginibacter sp. ZT4R22]|uniref:Uncharacterized protein n=1 Tax=Mucilaginibacter pankratovii TaxID=2772110 RepID=A0ABR7WQ83_9SPHI|nr:hypothetical protein [Mucilaginibacter pankratovii]MBD1364490.1 hypothetical protein [Mucilaginibacter pankratovii]